MPDVKGLVRAFAALGEGRSTLETYRDRLQEEFDEKSEKWQESPAGEAVQEKIQTLDDIISSVEEIEGQIEDLAKE